MNEDLGMNEAQKEVRLWRKTDLKRRFVIQAIIDVFMQYFYSKEEATVLYREVRERRGSSSVRS